MLFFFIHTHAKCVRKHSVYSLIQSALTLAHTRAEPLTLSSLCVCVCLSAFGLCVAVCACVCIESRVYWKKYGYVNKCCFLCRWRKVFVAKEFSEKRRRKKSFLLSEGNNSRKIYDFQTFEIHLVSEIFCILLIKWIKFCQCSSLRSNGLVRHWAIDGECDYL